MAKWLGGLVRHSRKSCLYAGNAASPCTRLQGGAAVTYNLWLPDLASCNSSKFSYFINPNPPNKGARKGDWEDSRPNPGVNNVCNDA